MALDDAEIIERMQRQDAAGLEALLRQYGPGVKAWLGATCDCKRDVHLLEDAVHDAALILRRVADRLDPDRNLRAYFFTVARRELLHALEALPNERTSADDVLDAAVQPPTVSVPTPFTERLAAYIESLSPLERAILGADAASGFTAPAAEIAEYLETSVSTVYSLRNRTKNKLAEFLDGEQQSDDDRAVGGA